MALGAAGCGDDDGNGGGTGGSAGSGGTAGSGGAAGSGGEGGTAGAAGMGGQGGSGGMSEAKAFCDDYASICGFGDGFSDQEDCETTFDGFVSTRQECVVMHLGFAGEGDTALHCPHAAGAAPCD